MFLVRVILIALLWSGLAHAQTNPGFLPGRQLPANQLNSALQSKKDWSTSNCIDIEFYGGKGDGVTDNSAAYNLAITKFAPGLTGKCLRFGSGIYVFSATPNPWFTSSNMDSISFIGNGSDVTILHFPMVGTGFAINLQSPQNSFHLRDFSITTGTVGVGGYAFSIVTVGDSGSPAYDAPNDVIGVTVRGFDGYFGGVGADYWSTGIRTNASNVNWINDYFIGASNGGNYQPNGLGVLVYGIYAGGNCFNVASQFPVAHQFIGTQFNIIGTGVQLGECVQGPSFTNTNFTGGKYGIVVPAGIHQFDQIIVVNSQFNVSNSGIIIESSVTNFVTAANVYYLPLNGSVGITLGVGPGSYSVTGSQFASIATSGFTNGLVIGFDPSVNSVVSGNTFYNGLPGVGTPTTTGIFLQSGSRSALVTGNTFAFLSANILDQGANNVIVGNYPEYHGYTISGSGTLTQIACNAATAGIRVYVGNGLASPTYSAAVGATGTTVQSVQCDSTNWTYH